MTLILSGTDGVSDIDGTAATPAIRGTDTNTGIFFPAADTIAFSEGGAEAARLDSSGRLLIGTATSPNAGNVGQYARLFNAGNTTGANQAGIYAIARGEAATSITSGEDIGFLTFTDSAGNDFAYIQCQADANAGSGDYPSRLVFATTADGSSTVTERMRIDSTGNVGIGTSSPAGRLGVQSPSSNAALTNSVFVFNDGSGSGTGARINLGVRAEENRSAGVSGFYDGTGTSLGFYTVTAYASGSQAERARITSGGNLLVGTTDSDYRIRALGTSSIGGLRVDAPGSGSYWPVYFNDTDNTSSSQIMVDIRRADTRVGYIATTNTATNYATSSDYRLKENIISMIGALNTVAQLNPVTYTWKVDGSAGQGFIAHELQEVCPDAVTGEKDATEIQRVEVSPAIPATYDEDGNELTPTVEAVYEEREVPVYQGVDTSFLVATLTAAIQELKAITDAQATRIEALEAQNAAFEARLAALENK